MKSRPPRLTFSAAIILAFSPLAVKAGDWYSWRGPTQDGRSAEPHARGLCSDCRIHEWLSEER